MATRATTCQLASMAPSKVAAAGLAAAVNGPPVRMRMALGGTRAAGRTTTAALARTAARTAPPRPWLPASRAPWITKATGRSWTLMARRLPLARTMKATGKLFTPCHEQLTSPQDATQALQPPGPALLSVRALLTFFIIHAKHKSMLFAPLFAFLRSISAFCSLPPLRSFSCRFCRFRQTYVYQIGSLQINRGLKA